MRKLINKYKKILNHFTTSPSISSSLSPSQYEYRELKSPSPNDLIKKLKQIKIKQKTM